MNNNEKELERTGYDNWKLRSRDDEIKRVELNLNHDKRFLPNLLGKCPRCEENIFENDMWTFDEEKTLYHFQCYNYKIKAEEEEKRSGK